MKSKQHSIHNDLLKTTLAGGSIALTILSIGIITRNESEPAAPEAQPAASVAVVELSAIPTVMPLPTATATPAATATPVLPTAMAPDTATTPIETEVPTATATVEPTATPQPTPTAVIQAQPLRVAPPVRSRSSR